MLAACWAALGRGAGQPVGDVRPGQQQAGQRGQHQQRAAQALAAPAPGCGFDCGCVIACRDQPIAHPSASAIASWLCGMTNTPDTRPSTRIATGASNRAAKQARSSPMSTPSLSFTALPARTSARKPRPSAANRQARAGKPHSLATCSSQSCGWAPSCRSCAWWAKCIGPTPSSGCCRISSVARRHKNHAAGRRIGCGPRDRIGQRIQRVDAEQRRHEFQQVRHTPARPARP